MQDCAVYYWTAIFMENTGTGLHSMADRIGEGAMVGPPMWLSGAWDSDCP